MRGTFVLPNIDSLLRCQAESCDKIVVVSIIGKTAFNSFGLKLKVLGRMFTSALHRSKECSIEGYLDEENQIMYLHAHSLLDTDNFIENYDKLSEKCSEGSSDFLSIYDHVKSEFAKTLFTLFYISHVVILSHPTHTFDINYIQYFKSIETIRLKMLEELSDSLRDVEHISNEWITAGRPCTPRLLFYFERCPKNITNIKKFEHNLEDRIYHILRKTRIISSSNPSSLFAIPPNEEFVFVSAEGSPDRLGQAVRGLIMGCQPGAAVQIEAPFCSQPDSSHSFQKFLRQHVHQARNKGFDDVVTSRHSHMAQPAHFELPSIKHWALASKAIYNLINNPSLIQQLCTDTRFSKQRCLKVLPMAFARYQEGLPSHYTSAIHQTRLNMAIALFNTQARGPMFQQYHQRLVDDCEAYWEDSRKLCEAPSLTGNPCNLPKHADDKQHCSGARFVAVCDCGRTQGSRDDPYSWKQANYTFYNNLSKECACAKMERITFPKFKPSTKDYKAAIIETDYNLSLSDKSPELTPEEKLKRQPSTSEYLPGMLTTASPSGLLPEYNSWALVCLGPSSLYSHNLGLSETYHPGFYPTTNYLLPWDVVVYTKAKPILLDPQVDSGKPHLRRKVQRPTNRVPQFTVKVFIGAEYECPRGHRFMLSAPDKILKAAPGSIVKETGHKIADSDLPLYFPCVCSRGGKSLSGQLMRLHIVTPKAPVHVTVNAKVQPSPGAPIFLPTIDGPSTLTQAAYWVLRLPYVYVSDQENFLENHAGRLLQGVFAVKKNE